MKLLTTLIIASGFLFTTNAFATSSLNCPMKNKVGRKEKTAANKRHDAHVEAYKLIHGKRKGSGKEVN